jgi:hypothetical protein
MSAVRELTLVLIKAGLDPVDAATLIARAGVELAPPADTRTPGARRQAAYRERHKTSQIVTEVTVAEASPSVTKRNETSQSDAASLSKEDKKEEVKLKREGARASQLPADWRPDVAVWDETSEILSSNQRAEYELTKFKDHALEKGRTAKNWNAAWRNWARRSVEYGGRNGNGSSQNRTDTAAGRATAREVDFVARVGGTALQYLKNRNSGGQAREVPTSPSSTEGHDPERDAAWAAYQARVGSR